LTPLTDVHVVSHTHWDREWYLTREQFRLRLVDLVDRVLDLMDTDPRFSFFHLDGQTIVLEDYLEVRPEAEERLRRRIAEGRLLVGPWYVMPDMFLVSGEALVRNLALGHRLARGLGGVMRVGYMPDPFGHIAQMPQILSQLGLASAVLWRGFGSDRAESVWESPDGSRVLLLHLPREGYGNAALLPILPAEEARRRAREVIERERGRSAGGTVLLMAGTDHLEPNPKLLDLVADLAALPGLDVRLSTLPAYVAAARSRAEGARLDTVRGELRSMDGYAFLLPGVLSARTYLKQRNARVQRTLETVSPALGAALQPLGLNAAGVQVHRDEQATRPAGVLAYGDLKKLELAIALANDPALLLLDEPTAGMAPGERGALMALTARIARERGLTVLFTEHDMDVVFAVAERIMVLHQGRLIADGPPAAVRADREVQAVYLGEDP